jgi:hypothetical protein
MIPEKQASGFSSRHVVEEFRTESYAFRRSKEFPQLPLCGRVLYYVRNDVFPEIKLLLDGELIVAMFTQTLQNPARVPLL